MSLVAGEADAGLRLDVAVTAAAKLQEVVLLAHPVPRT